MKTSNERRYSQPDRQLKARRSPSAVSSDRKPPHQITGDLRRALKAGYNPGQPRRRDGTPQSGWWSSNRYFDDTDKIVAAAQRFRLAAFSERYSSCVDLCYPLLERRQPVGSDFNLWDYHKCLNRCLGR